MTYNEVKELLGIFEGSNVQNLELTIDNVSVKMNKGTTDTLQKSYVNIDSYEQKPVSYAKSKETESVPSPALDESGTMVKAPIVGTFYASPGIDKDNFVNVGSVVKKGDTLCILEAMKIMNEVVSPCDGIVAEIYALNNDMVEYGKSLFRIK